MFVAVYATARKARGNYFSLWYPDIPLRETCLRVRSSGNQIKYALLINREDRSGTGLVVVKIRISARGLDRSWQLGSLSTRVFETRTATGSELFSLLTCPHTTTFTFLSIFSLLEMSSIKIWETIPSLHAKCSLPVAVRVSETRALKLPNAASWDNMLDKVNSSSTFCNTF